LAGDLVAGAAKTGQDTAKSPAAMAQPGKNRRPGAGRWEEEESMAGQKAVKTSSGREELGAAQLGDAKKMKKVNG
jgi:hypothetical protein